MLSIYHIYNEQVNIIYETEKNQQQQNMWELNTEQMQQV